MLNASILLMEWFVESVREASLAMESVADELNYVKSIHALCKFNFNRSKDFFHKILWISKKKSKIWIFSLTFSGAGCTDTDQGAVCGPCPSGYEGDGRTCTLRYNQCNDRPCDEGLFCSQTNDSPYYRCEQCDAGFTSEDGFNCVDIDECYTLRPCDQKVQCTNLSPGFKCEPCPAGYGGQHDQGLYMASVTDHTFQRQQCIDIDECRERIAKCGLNSHCLNTDGSYTCACLTGFMPSNTSTGCVPIPGVCADGVTVCDKNAICRSLGGRRYGCKCKVGFAGDGFHCGGDRDLDGWPDQDLRCPHAMCRQDNCPSIPVR